MQVAASRCQGMTASARMWSWSWRGSSWGTLLSTVSVDIGAAWQVLRNSDKTSTINPNRSGPLWPPLNWISCRLAVISLIKGSLKSGTERRVSCNLVKYISASWEEECLRMPNLECRRTICICAETTRKPAHMPFPVGKCTKKVHAPTPIVGPCTQRAHFPVLRMSTELAVEAESATEWILGIVNDTCVSRLLSEIVLQPGSHIHVELRRNIVAINIPTIQTGVRCMPQLKPSLPMESYYNFLLHFKRMIIAKWQRTMPATT
jgi:hypothetical protein